MGAMGRYIDGLGDEARDRVIEGQVWVPGTQADYAGGGCLLGQANGSASEARTARGRYVPELTLEGCRSMFRMVRRDAFFGPQGRAAQAFNLACLRFGIPRTVAAIKLRAAKPHRISLPASPSQKSIVEQGMGAEVGAD